MTERATHRWPALAGRSSAEAATAEASPDLESLKQQARADGYQQGFSEGLAKGEAQAQEQARAQLKTITDALENTRSQLRDRLARVDAELPVLAQALLTCLGVSAIEQAPGFLTELLQDAASRLALDAASLTMVVSADWDLETLPDGVQVDGDLPPRRIEIRSPSAFARLDVAAVVTEVIHDHQVAMTAGEMADEPRDNGPPESKSAARDPTAANPDA